jgi:2-polyprenyl-3-methyl-5-hydroxy-6-metoxy-1,4-benzoquinol methylase
MGYDSNYFEASRREMHAFLPEQFSTALEIGCGDGGFWRGYKTDAEVWGIEPDPRAAETSRESMKTVFNDLYDRAEAELPDGYFDLVLCNDVIEHMVDHDRFFEQIKKKLSPNGVLVVSLPNVRYY